MTRIIILGQVRKKILFFSQIFLKHSKNSPKENIKKKRLTEEVPSGKKPING